MTHKPRIVFAGTPAFAASHLQALISANHNIVGIYTQPDRPGKRGKKLVASPVKTVAQEYALDVYQPVNFKDADDVACLAALKPDLLIVVAYGLILPQTVLDIPTIEAINVHGSLLPRWRGAAPIERAIEAGDKKTGVGIMKMEASLDTGPVFAEAKLDISPEMTGDELREALVAIACPLLLSTIDALINKHAKATVQAEQGINYAHKLNRKETAIDWSNDSGTIVNKVRAFNSSNVTTFNVGDKRIKLWRCTHSDKNSNAAPGTIISHDNKMIHIQCGTGAIAMQQLQMPGGKALNSRDILNGHAASLSEGTLLT